MARESKAQSAERDRERIISFFMQEMYSELILHKDELFEPHAERPRLGDLVFLTSARPTKWQIAWFVEDGAEYGSHLLRAVGTGELCNWTNVGLRIVNRTLAARAEFLEGWQRRAYETTMRALAKLDAYFYRFGGIRFNGTTMMFRIRPHVWVDTVAAYDAFEVSIRNADKLTIKRAADALQAGGVGSRFESKQHASGAALTDGGHG